MTDAETPAKKTQKPRPRSPSYPGIDLKTAIERARIMFEEEQRSAAHVDVLYGHWGHKPGSGAGGVTLAALKKFGIVTDEGSGANRRARLTDTALTILLDDVNSPPRRAVIREAALKPAIHQEVWSKYVGSLPSDQSLRMWLIRDKAFTPGGADEFIGQLRRTVAYAGLTASDKIGAPEQPQEASEIMAASSASATSEAKQSVVPSTRLYIGASGRPSMSIQLPLGTDSGWASLDAPFPLSEESWALMLRVLEVMKPGLVQPPTDDKND